MPITTSCELAGELLRGDPEPRRQPLDGGDQRRTMGLTSGEETQSHGGPVRSGVGSVTVTKTRLSTGLELVPKRYRLAATI
jgi:hypothetical protein